MIQLFFVIHFDLTVKLFFIYSNESSKKKNKFYLCKLFVNLKVVKKFLNLFAKCIIFFFVSSNFIFEKKKKNKEINFLRF